MWRSRAPPIPLTLDDEKPHANLMSDIASRAAAVTSFTGPQLGPSPVLGPTGFGASTRYKRFGTTTSVMASNSSSSSLKKTTKG